MKVAQSIRTGTWLLIGLNLFMALGSIGIFTRMAPAIEQILERNQRSLAACESMLASLILAGEQAEKKAGADFAAALTVAQNNITEKEEPEALAVIAANYEQALLGETGARKTTVSAIIQLGDINRDAMNAADRRAQQLGQAGAWGIVFMATCVFTAGLVFKNRLLRNLLQPVEEIHQVFRARRSGNHMRRCTGTHLPRDVRAVFDEINDFLDDSGFPLP